MNSNSNLLGTKSPSLSPQKQNQPLSLSDKKKQGDNTKYPICFQCKNRIKEKQCVVLGQKKYHIDHFRCNQCNQKLTNRLFYEYRNKIYCEDDYKQVIAPICHQCKNFIQGKYISAKNLSFHLECFVCQGCNFGIEEKQEFFFSADKKFIYCKKCKKKCSEVCQKCKRVIKDNEQLINGSYYHIECLTCQKCHNQNTQGMFVLHNNQIVHDTCILICHHCNQKIEDEKDISHYFEYVLHSKCQQAYTNFIRQKTIDAFKTQNSKNFKNQQNNQNLNYSPSTNLSPPSYSVNLNQLESMFSNSLDQLNRQFQETKIKDNNFDLEIEMSNLASENLDLPSQNIQATTGYKLSEDEISPKNQVNKKKESLLQLPSSQDKQLCIKGASISALKIQNKKKQTIEIINSESENDSD